MWTLIDDLDAFYLEHRRCGRLDTAIENGRVWKTCECGVVLSRAVLGKPLERVRSGQTPEPVALWNLQIVRGLDKLRDA